MDGVFIAKAQSIFGKMVMMEPSVNMSIFKQAGVAAYKDEAVAAQWQQ